MLEFYFWLGGEIYSLKEKGNEGSSLYQKLSNDLVSEFPDVKSFSVTNLKYMQYFYELYVSPQLVDSEKKSSPQLVDYHKMGIFSIPWGHNRTIIDKCKGDKN